MATRRSDEATRLDDAARAGWLYYVAGKTQDEIAKALKISRQSAQRLVSLSVSAGLVKVRIDHPIAACLDLAQRLRERFGIDFAEVVPTDPASSSTTLGIALAGADEMERRLRQADPLVIAMGTGRTLKSVVEHLPRMDCPQHRIVSLTANITLDGSASVYNVIFSMADRIRAAHYPMPLPAVASSPAERMLLHEQKVVKSTLALAAQADVTFVGVGDVGPDAPLVKDGYVTPEECRLLLQDGGIGEIVGWVFDREGHLLDCSFNERVASAPLPPTSKGEVIMLGMGPVKTPPMRAALKGRLVNGIVTDQATATALLDD
jgi:DNA-binding transcriptional regulator LsrR (DeoR family)